MRAEESSSLFSIKLGDSSNSGGAYAKRSVKIKSSQRPSATSSMMVSRRVLSSSVSRASPDCTDAFRLSIKLTSPVAIFSFFFREPPSLRATRIHCRIFTEHSRIRETLKSRELGTLDHPHLRTLLR